MSSPQSTNLLIDPATIRVQLQRLLDHPLFNHSKRYPTLLAYTVEQTLLGNAAELKERTIGFQAFGREPDYDVNLDPVVRTSAAEVRKRLIQYYYDPAHAGELLIEFSVGSYVPSFRLPDATRSAAAIEIEPLAEDDSDAAIGLSAPDTLVSTVAANAPRTEASTRKDYVIIRHRWVLVASLILAASIGFVAGRYRPTPPPSNIDRFWEPISSSAASTTYCLGEPAQLLNTGTVRPPNGQNVSGPNSALDGKNIERLQLSGRMNLLDVVTLVRTIPPTVLLRGTFRVLPSSEASFAQLREGPVVLIGALDNLWTLRITQNLRFGFESKDGFSRIIDHKSSQETPWSVQGSIPSRQLTRDYAVIARIRDNTTGQPVIILGGLSDQGTEAASEVVYNPVYLNALLAKAPKNWDRLNMEVVVATNLIDGHAGPPEILAVETW